jgi:hypothetical protein
MSNSSTIQGGAGSAMNCPLLDPQAWDKVQVAGIWSPGVCHIEGFSRDATWQKKEPKGGQGATTTLVQLPPAKGSLIFTLYTVADFNAWQTFKTLFIITAAPGATSDSQAVSISHPSLDDVFIRAVLPEKLYPIRHLGKGLYKTRVDLIEWIPTPKQAPSLVQTTTMVNPNPKSTMPAVGATQPSTLQKLKNTQAALLSQLQNSP